MFIFARIIIVAIVFFAWVKESMGLEYPVTYWVVEGAVRDWKTKHGVADALVLVFLNKSPHMNFGFNPEQSDYPDLPRTSQAGQFTLKAVLYQSAPQKQMPETVELLVLKPGYRSEKFVLTPSQFALSTTKGAQVLKLKDVELVRYDDLVDVDLVKDAQQACKLAQLAVERKHLNTSQHNMIKPQSVETVSISGPRKAWRVAFALKNPAKGGQIVVLIDCRTGRAECCAGE